MPRAKLKSQSRYGGKIPQKVEDEYGCLKIPLLPKLRGATDKSTEINRSVKKLLGSSV
jgi:hypothetical protein